MPPCPQLISPIVKTARQDSCLVKGDGVYLCPPSARAEINTGWSTTPPADPTPPRALAHARAPASPSLGKPQSPQLAPGKAGRSVALTVARLSAARPELDQEPQASAAPWGHFSLSPSPSPRGGGPETG